MLIKKVDAIYDMWKGETPNSHCIKKMAMFQLFNIKLKNNRHKPFYCARLKDHIPVVEYSKAANVNA